MLSLGCGGGGSETNMAKHLSQTHPDGTTGASDLHLLSPAGCNPQGSLSRYHERIGCPRPDLGRLALDLTDLQTDSTSGSTREAGPLATDHREKFHLPFEEMLNCPDLSGEANLLVPNDSRSLSGGRPQTPSVDLFMLILLMEPRVSAVNGAEKNKRGLKRGREREKEKGRLLADHPKETDPKIVNTLTCLCDLIVGRKPSTWEFRETELAYPRSWCGWCCQTQRVSPWE